MDNRHSYKTIYKAPSFVGRVGAGCLLLLCCFLNVSAQDTLTLERVRELALEHNHKVRDARLTTQIAQQAVRQYRANYFPDFSLVGAAAYGTSRRTLIEVPGALASGIASAVTRQPMVLGDIGLDWEMGWLWHGGVQMKQPIYMGGRIVAANSIARHSLAMARHNERLTDTEVIELADAAYINVVRATELSDVARRYNALLVELEKNVQSAVDVGLKMPADLLRVQVKKNETELHMRRAENALRLARMNLGYVIGSTTKTHTSALTAEEGGLSCSISGLDNIVCVLEGLDSCGNSDVTSHSHCGESRGVVSVRPESLIMQEKLDIARQQVRVARAEALPSVALLANYGYTSGLKVGGQRLLDGADFLGGVTVSVPLFHFGERAAKIRTAKLRAEQARNELENVNEQLSLALQKAENELNEAVLEAQLGDLSVQQAQTSLKMTRHQYDAGMATLGDLLDAQALWQQAHQARIDAYCNLHTARTALQKAMGVLR